MQQASSVNVVDQKKAVANSQNPTAQLALLPGTKESTSVTVTLYSNAVVMLCVPPSKVPQALLGSLKGPPSLNGVSEEDGGALFCLCCKQITWKAP